MDHQTVEIIDMNPKLIKLLEKEAYRVGQLEALLKVSSQYLSKKTPLSLKKRIKEVLNEADNG